MRIGSLILSLALASGLACLSQDANAARAYSNNYIYFDTAGNAVGQDAYHCNGAHWRGGDLTAPYRLTIKGSCSGTTQACTPAAPSDPLGSSPPPDRSGTPTCVSVPSGDYVQMSLTASAPFTRVEACELAGQGVCESTEPVLLDYLDLSIAN